MNSSQARTGLCTIVAVALVALVAVGCGGGGSTGAGAEPTGGETPKAGGTLNVALLGDVLSLMPTETIDLPGEQVITQIMEPLVRTNAEGKLEPWLAKSYDVSPDNLTWTFHLRPGVKFSDGQPLTAADVVFSLDAVRTSTVRESLYEEIASVKESSPSTVVVKTREPAPGLLSTLSLFAAVIVPKDYGGVSAKEFGENPIGTGPFELVKWTPGQSLNLAPNPHYWRQGLPYAEQIVFHAVPEDNSRVSQLRSGQLDVIASPTWSQLTGLEQQPGMQVDSYPSTYTDTLILNVRKPPFDDPKIREAVNVALDREAIVDAALSGHGEPAGSWFGPSVLYHDTAIKPPAQDLQQAKTLLAEATGGGPAPSVTLLEKAGETYASVASQVIEQNLSEAGFKVEIQPLDESTLIEQTAAGKFDLTLLAYSSDIVDPSQATAFYTSTEAFFAGVEPTAVTKLAQEAATAADPKKREGLFNQIQELIASENNIIALDYQPFVWALQDDVAGFEVNATNYPMFATVGFAE